MKMAMPTWTTWFLLFFIRGVDSYNTNFCVGKSGQYYADPDDCLTYYQCSNGQTFHRSCGPGTEWDDSVVTCVLISSSGCTALAASQATTQSPVEDTTQESQSGATTQLSAQTSTSPGTAAAAWVFTNTSTQATPCERRQFSLKTETSCQNQGLTHSLPHRVDCAIVCTRMPSCAGFRYEGGVCQIQTNC